MVNAPGSFPAAGGGGNAGGAGGGAAGGAAGGMAGGTAGGAAGGAAGGTVGAGFTTASTGGRSSAGRGGSTGSGPAAWRSQAANDENSGMNSVMTVRPSAPGMVSRMRARSIGVSRASRSRSLRTSSASAPSAIWTIAAAPVARTCALWVRIPSSTATHLRRRKRALNSSVIEAGQVRAGRRAPAGRSPREGSARRDRALL